MAEATKYVRFSSLTYKMRAHVQRDRPPKMQESNDNLRGDESSTMNFGLIGAAGFIAPRHMQAIHDTGNNLLAAVDPHDCVGRLDSYFPDARYFTEIERFDRFLEKRRRGPEEQRVQYVSICTPNYLHDSHVRLALRVIHEARPAIELVFVLNNTDTIAHPEYRHPFLESTQAFDVVPYRKAA